LEKQNELNGLPQPLMVEELVFEPIDKIRYSLR
jgi:hypothetical protein